MGGQPVVAPTTAHNGSATSPTTGANAQSPTTATGNATPPTTTGTRKPSSPIATTIPDKFKGSSYEELIPHLEKKVAEYKPLTEEELKKLRRRQKAEGVISGISDVVRSIANLVATHNYAPNMYNPTDGMSARVKARFEKEKAEREAEEDKWFNYAMTLGKLRGADKDRGLQVWQTEQGLARQARQDELAQAKADRDAELAKLEKELKQGKIDYQAALTREAQIRADYREKYEKARLGKLNRSGSGSNGGGVPGQFTCWRYNPKTGEKEYKGGFKSQKAARNFAKTYGDEGWNYSEGSSRSSTTKPDKYGTDITTTRITDDSYSYNTQPWSSDNL